VNQAAETVHLDSSENYKKKKNDTRNE